MLNITNLKNAKAADEYFELKYYTQDDLANISSWWGQGANKLGLNGAVEPGKLTQLLNGELSESVKLGRIANGERVHRAGYDLTFSAPKSISLIGLHDKRVDLAIKQAVNDTLEFLERKTAQTRITVTREDGNKVTSSERTGNYCVAKIEHNTSRELDPDRHTHCVLINATMNKNGEWRSVSNELLYIYKMCGGSVYRSFLAKEIQKLGYEIEITRSDGLFDIKDFTREQIEHFSRRHIDIKAMMKEMGWSSYEASDKASLMTRKKKQKNIDESKLISSWDARLLEQNIDLRCIHDRALNNGPIKKYGQPEQALDATKFAIGHLLESNAVIYESAIIMHALNHSMGEITVANVEDSIKELSKSGKLYHIHEEAYTTPEMIALEQSNLNLLREGKNTFKPLVSDNKTLDKLIKDNNLTSSQGKAVKLILNSKDQIVGVQGYAGTGKSRTIGFIKDYLKSAHQGVEIMAIAPTGKAAGELRKIGVQADTIHSFLQNIENNKSNFNHRKEYLIFCDEMGMVDNKLMNKLLSSLKAQGIKARLPMFGDDKQLTSAGAGKPWEQFKPHMPVAEIDEIMRQKTEGALSAVKSVIADDIKGAFQNVGQFNISENSNRDEKLQEMADQYLNMSLNQQQRTLVLVQTNNERIKLNELIRDGLISSGQVKSGDTEHDILISKNLTSAQYIRSGYYDSGNIVRFNNNYDSLRIKKGDYCQVISRNDKDNSITLLSSSGKKIIWFPHKIAGPTDGAIEVFKKEQRLLSDGDLITFKRRSSYKTESGFAPIVTGETGVIESIKDGFATIKLSGGDKCKLNLHESQNQHIDYSYSVTTHAAQGATYDYAIANLDSENHSLTSTRLFYVAISRVRYQCYLHVDDQERVMEIIKSNDGQKKSALEEIEKYKEVDMPFPDKINDGAKYNKIANPKTNIYINPIKFKSYDFEEINSKISSYLPDIYSNLLGKEVNHKLSNGNKLRFGNKGSFMLDLDKGGVWYDHENQCGGNIYSFLKDKVGMDFKDSIDYLGGYIGLTKKEIELRKPSNSKSFQHYNKEEIKPEDTNAMDRAKQLWSRGKPIEGTLGERYLKEVRKLKLDFTSIDARFIPITRDRVSGNMLPCIMVAARKEDEIQAVQAIFLDPNTGNKADINSPKQTYGRIKFGANVTFRGDDNSRYVFICEGPETALTIKSAYPKCDVIATLGKSNFINVETDKGKTLVYCLDNDAGEKKTRADFLKIENHMKDKGYKVMSVIPNKEDLNQKYDFNDLLRDSGIDAVRSQVEDQLVELEVNMPSDFKSYISEICSKENTINVRKQRSKDIDLSFT